MKIMKKVLALVLALAVLIVPMAVSAATGDPVATPPWSNYINTGAEVTVPANSTSYFEIGTGSTTDVAFPFVVEGTGDFTVAVCTEGTEEGYAYAEGTPVAAVDGKVTTTITGYSSTYNCGAFAITNNTDAEVTYTCTIQFPEGSQENPASITVELYTDVTVTVPAGGNYYLAATLPETQVDYQMSVIGTTGFGVSTGFMPTYDTEGVVTFTANAYYGTYNFSIVNTTESEQTYTLLLEDMPFGSSSNPDYLAMNYTTTIELENTEYYYTWTATKPGTVKFAIDTEATGENWTYKLTHNDISYHYSTAWGESDKNVLFVNVAADDVISVGVSVPTYNADYDYYDAYTPASGTVVFSTALGTSGDVNCDKNLTVDDLTMIRKGILGAVSVEDNAPGAYDANNDGSFDIRDLVITKRKIVGVIYVGDAVAVPESQYCIYSGETATVGAGETIYFEISTNQIYDVLPFNIVGEGNFTVAVCTEDGEGAYLAGAPVASADGVVSTDIQGYESTYGYACFAITNNSDAEVTYTCTIDFPVGVESNPYAVDLMLYWDAYVTVPANTQYYVAATLPEMYTEYQLTISGESQFGIPSPYGMPIWDTDGSIVTTAAAYRPTYTFSIINNTDSEQTYTLLLENMPLGSASNPDSLNMNQTYNVELDGSEYNYKWEVSYPGSFTVTFDNELCENGWTYKLNHNDTPYHFSTGWDESDKNVVSFDVAVGDVVTLGVSVPTYYEALDSWDPYTPATGTVVFTTEYDINLSEGDAVAVPSTDYFIYSGDSVTVPAGKTVVYEISTNNMFVALPFTVEGEGDFTVAVCTEDGNGAYVAGANVSATDGTVSTNLTGYESTYGCGCFIITNNSDADVTYTCTLTFPVGSEANPYGVTLELNGTATVTVPAGTQYYVAATLPAKYTEYQLTISGTSQFGIPSPYGMPIWDTDGEIVTTAAEYFSAYTFSIINNTDSAQTYTLLLENMPLGSASNPDALTVNTTITKELVDSSYSYAWTATEAGTFVFTIDNELCASGWTYKLTHNDNVKHYSTAWDETDKNVCTLTVAEGDLITVEVSVPAYVEAWGGYDAYTFASGTIVFTTEFTAE